MLKTALTVLLPWIVVLTAIFSIGCRPQEQIKIYTVPRTSPPRSPVDVDAVTSELDHILVAILPQQDKAWFFKLVGKAPAIARQRETFKAFLATIKLADSAEELPSWELPEGWREEPPTSKLRLATLLVPDESGSIELAVSSLPLSGEWEDFLVPNVTRWLGQLRRSPLTTETIDRLAKKWATQSGPATVLELSGVMSSPGAGIPHAGAGGDPHVGMGLPPTSVASAEVPPEEGALKYKKPKAWLPGKQSGMRKAAFLLPGGGSSDEVVVTSFSAASPQMAEVAPNVRRWAGQVGMTSLADADIEKLTEPISISGLDGTYLELISPDEAATQRAIYVAMVKRQGMVWFFKMNGTPEVVSGQRAAFREFLESVRFE